METVKKQHAEDRVRKALREFDDQPDSGGVRIPVVAALRACSVPTVWRHIKQGRLPQPQKMGGMAVMNVGELRRSMAKW